MFSTSNATRNATKRRFVNFFRHRPLLTTFNNAAVHFYSSKIIQKIDNEPKSLKKKKKKIGSKGILKNMLVVL